MISNSDCIAFLLGLFLFFVGLFVLFVFSVNNPPNYEKKNKENECGDKN